MAVIGIDLEPDQLVLTKGRDFKWTFRSLDENDNPVDYPDGDLFFEFATGGQHNAKQTVTMTGVAAGSSTWGIGAGTSPALPWDSAESVITAALENLPTVGAGNVTVKGSYVPQWLVEVKFGSVMQLSPGVVQAFNAAVAGAFNTMSWLGGGKVAMHGWYTPTSFTFTMTYRGSLLEQEFVNFVVQSVAGTIQTALNVVTHFTGKILSVNEFYAPRRVFEIEFVNDKALTPIPGIVVNTTSLTGLDPVVGVKTLAPGRSAVTEWHFDIAGSLANLKVEHPDVAAIPERTIWQLVYLLDGELAGGDPVARGSVKVQGAPK